MKIIKIRIMITIAALVVSSTSNALVADKFMCHLEVKDLGSAASAKEQKDFFIARLPLSASPSPDVRLTASETTESLTLDTPKAEFRANLNFYYKHAVKIDPTGTLSEARQFTCLGLTGNYCEKPGGGGPHFCNSSMVACMEFQNPFDPNNGWSPTRLINGVPTFNEQTLGPATARITDGKGNNVGTVNLSCQYMGTFQ